MKKAVSVLGAFCFGAFITIGAMACADDYSQVNAATIQDSSGCYLVESKTYGKVGEWYKEIYSYDEYGKLIQVDWETYVPPVDDCPKFHVKGSDQITYKENEVVFTDDYNQRKVSLRFNRAIKDCPVNIVNERVLSFYFDFKW